MRDEDGQAPVGAGRGRVALEERVLGLGVERGRRLVYRQGGIWGRFRDQIVPNEIIPAIRL